MSAWGLPGNVLVSVSPVSTTRAQTVVVLACESIPNTVEYPNMGASRPSGRLRRPSSVVRDIVGTVGPALRADPGGRPPVPLFGSYRLEFTSLLQAQHPPPGFNNMDAGVLGPRHGRRFEDNELSPLKPRGIHCISESPAFTMKC